MAVEVDGSPTDPSDRVSYVAHHGDTAEIIATRFSIPLAAVRADWSGAADWSEPAEGSDGYVCDLDGVTQGDVMVEDFVREEYERAGETLEDVNEEALVQRSILLARRWPVRRKYDRLISERQFQWTWRDTGEDVSSVASGFAFAGLSVVGALSLGAGRSASCGRLVPRLVVGVAAVPALWRCSKSVHCCCWACSYSWSTATTSVTRSWARGRLGCGTSMRPSGTTRWNQPSAS